MELSIVKRSDLGGGGGGHGGGPENDDDGGGGGNDGESEGGAAQCNLGDKLVQQSDEKGDVAQCRREANPELARSGLGLCSVSSQRASFGQARRRFTADKLCRPMLYAWYVSVRSRRAPVDSDPSSSPSLSSCPPPCFLVNRCFRAQEKLGMDEVQRHVGHEPSGEASDYNPFNEDGRPYNPMTTAGCLALCAILEPHREAEERLQTALLLWREMSGTSQPRLSLAGFEKKRELCNSDAEASLLHLMRQRHLIPQR